MPKTKVLITVKTYPSISRKYDETVCTAGFLEDGTWIRIYPIPFRKKEFDEQYKKYDWIEIDLVKRTNDFRKESYQPVSIDTEIKVLNHLDTTLNWEARKKIVLKNEPYVDMQKLITEAKDRKIITSLSVFKPTKIIDFKHVETEREWDQQKLRTIREQRTYNLFAKQDEDLFEVVKKLPYKFSYVFEDCNGKESTLMIKDWEIGQLYWNCLQSKGSEEEALKDVKNKYFNDFAKTKDLHFFLGTTFEHHYVSHNPFIIIGTFHPKKDNQISMF